jgi:long-subunit acyl-CoA synthetase (AMP-forming)
MSAKTWADVITPCAPIKEPVKRTKDEMATIIYTSGSTGKPKGVMTSFMAMTDTSKGITKVMNINSEDRYLSYLPIAHGMERWLGMVRKNIYVYCFCFCNSFHFDFLDLRMAGGNIE